MTLTIDETLRLDRGNGMKKKDLKHIEKRLLHHLIGDKACQLTEIDHEVIVVAKDLRPTQTANFDPRFVKGIACDTGGETGHASIVARAMGIPAVVALDKMTGKLNWSVAMEETEKGRELGAPSSLTYQVVDGMAEHPGDTWGPIGWFKRWRWSRA